MSRALLAAIAGAALCVSPAIAIDLGDPSFPSPEGGETVRTELLYSTIRRSIRYHNDPIGLGLADVGPVNQVAWADWNSTFSDDLFVSRAVLWPTPMVAVQLDLGFAGEANSDGDQAIVLGGAVRGLLTESGPFQLTAQVHGAAMPEVEYRVSGSSSLGTFLGAGESDFYEAGGALLASFEQPINQAVRGTVYGGPEVSVFREEWSEYADYSDINDRVWLSGVAKQRSPWRFVLGGHLELGETWGVRSEARIALDTEFSVGVTWRK